MQPRTLSVNEARAQLGIGRTKFYQLLQQHVIRSILLGRRRLVLAEDLDLLVERLLNEHQDTRVSPYALRLTESVATETGTEQHLAAADASTCKAAR